MDPDRATCRPAPASRPPAMPLVEPVHLDADLQPVLPWTMVPEVIPAHDPIDPELRQLASALMSALIEVLSGQRSSLQLERWVDQEVLNLVEHLRRSRRAQGLTLRSLRVQAPNANVLEVSAHLRQGTASRAAALRVSRRRDRWIATHLSIALRPHVVNQAGWINPVAG